MSVFPRHYYSVTTDTVMSEHALVQYLTSVQLKLYLCFLGYVVELFTRWAIR